MKFIYILFYNIILTLIHAKNSKKDININSSNTITYSINNISSSIIKSTFSSNENELLISSFISNNTKTTIKIINYSRNNNFITTQIKNKSLFLYNSTSILTQDKLNIKSSLIDYNTKNNTAQTYNLFFLQAQLIGTQLKIYMLCDFEVSKDFSFLVIINIYNKSLRFLEQNKKKVNR